MKNKEEKFFNSSALIGVISLICVACLINWVVIGLYEKELMVKILAAGGGALSGVTCGLFIFRLIEWDNEKYIERLRRRDDESETWENEKTKKLPQNKALNIGVVDERSLFELRKRAEKSCRFN